MRKELLGKNKTIEYLKKFHQMIQSWWFSKIRSQVRKYD